MNNGPRATGNNQQTNIPNFNVPNQFPNFNIFDIPRRAQEHQAASLYLRDSSDVSGMKIFLNKLLYKSETIKSIIDTPDNNEFTVKGASGAVGILDFAELLTTDKVDFANPTSTS